MKNIFYVVVMTTILACTNKESYNSNLADWNGKQTPVGRSLTTDEIAQLKKEENALFSMSPIPLNKLEFNEWSNNISFVQIDKMYREFIKKNIANKRINSFRSNIAPLIVRKYEMLQKPNSPELAFYVEEMIETDLSDVVLIFNGVQNLSSIWKQEKIDEIQWKLRRTTEDRIVLIEKSLEAEKNKLKETKDPLWSVIITQSIQQGNSDLKELNVLLDKLQGGSSAEYDSK